MNNIKNGLLYRLTWATLAIVLATYSALNFDNGQNISALILGLGWAFMAASWFMQPLILKQNINLSGIKNLQIAHSIGSPFARMFFTFSGSAFLIVGTVLKLILEN